MNWVWTDRNFLINGGAQGGGEALEASPQRLDR